ncbi:MAG: DNA-binding protein [Nitrosarchaeum sp.]|nr:DNA-binding protein [Nitrosarchaeum sp.]
MSDPKKSNDAEDILSEFHDTHILTEPEPQVSSPEPQVSSPEPQVSSPEPQVSSPEPMHQLPSPEPMHQLPSPEPMHQLPSPENDSVKQTIHDPEERDVIFIGTKPLLSYVAATLTQLSTRRIVTITARGNRITQAVDVSQMIVKRMNTVGYVVHDVRILSVSLKSQDGKLRNVSTIEIDITKN